MSLLSRVAARVWMVVPVLALVFASWAQWTRAHRLSQISALIPLELSIDAHSPTGYAGGRRGLLLAETMNEPFSWIAQTQQMLDRGEWRVRHTDDENAPAGRDVLTASPYRWYLAGCAWLDHAVTGRPVGLAVEHAALWADPALQLVLIAAVTGFCWWQFGGWAGALASAAVAGLYPLHSAFVPGVPTDDPVTLAGALAMLLFFAAGCRPAADPAGPAALPAGTSTGWFAASGVLGGLGLWVSATGQGVLIAGLIAGGLLAAGSKGADQPSARQWRIWAGAGALTVLLAFLVEFAPGHLGGWHLARIHPVYGIGWLAGAELVVGMQGWRHAAGTPRGRWLLSTGLGAAGLVALGVALASSDLPATLSGSLTEFRLSKEPEGVFASGMREWLVRDGLSLPLLATLAPLLAAGVTAIGFARQTTTTRARGTIALLLGPVVAASIVALLLLREWQACQVAVIALLAVAVSAAANIGRAARWLLGTTLVAALGTGLSQAFPPHAGAGNLVLAVPEAEGLIARDLAHWLRQRTAPDRRPVVLAAPAASAALSYYGGIPVIGTFSPENTPGIGAAARIANATSRAEAAALVSSRGITHIVLCSWDTFLHDYARNKGEMYERSFIRALDDWALPAWLRPMPYQGPGIPGMEDHTVTVFEVVDEQEPAVSLSRLAEYFVETGRLELAGEVSTSLQRYPADVGALVARAQVEAARDNQPGANTVLELLQARLARNSDRFLPWDRRVSLAIVLARQHRIDLARPQTERCIAELTPARARSLTTGSLFNLMVLAKGLRVEIRDPALRREILATLPPALRQKLD